MDKTFAEKLKETRKAAGLSQQSMADKMLIPKRTIQDWEGGLRTPPSYVQRFVINELAEKQVAEWREVVVNGVGYHKECTACGTHWMLDSQEHVCKETPFCPGCGAKMESEDTE